MDFERLKSIRPLIIEDEPEVLHSLFSIFNTLFDVFYTARNGEEGLYRFYKENPDVIITDLQMPFMGGFRMLDRIRIENKEVPIIITSAHTQPHYLEQAKELRVSEYLVKPYDIDELFQKIYTSCVLTPSDKVDLYKFPL